VKVVFKLSLLLGVTLTDGEKNVPCRRTVEASFELVDNFSSQYSPKTTEGR
jgi:hypothetical protein